MNTPLFVELMHASMSQGKSIVQSLREVHAYHAIEKKSRHADLSDYNIRGYSVDCINPQSLAFLYQEIFTNEAYRFNSAAEQPLIIDGGVNIGLSILYFKHQYPNCRIIGFEPHPDAYRVAKQNVDKNGLIDVELIQAALADHRGGAELNYIDHQIMASTIGARLDIRKENKKTVDVKTVLLSDYLNQKVDYLKLDIEGAETLVLKESQNKLRNIQHMLVEYHYSHGESNNSFPAVLDILEQAGFYYICMTTLAVERQASKIAYDACGPVSSVSILAKRID